MIKRIAIVLMLLASSHAFATKIYKVDISDFYKKSDLVLYGTIVYGKALPNGCGVEYIVRVETPFKGKIRPGALIKFRNNEATDIGANYFLFLSALEREFSPIASTNSNATNMQNRYIARCKSTWPAFVVNAFGNGALKSTATYNNEAPQAVLINDRVLGPPKSLQVVQLESHDRYDNDRRDRAIEADQFLQYMKTLSKEN